MKKILGWVGVVGFLAVGVASAAEKKEAKREVASARRAKAPAYVVPAAQTPKERQGALRERDFFAERHDTFSRY